MLNSLRFQNIALFGNTEIDFEKGFTAFTGQTGSGKSIFIDTLNALLANKKTPLDNRLVAEGSLCSSIEGVFSILQNTKNWLINQELDIDEELIDILYQPSKRTNSKEAFRGFINLFDDYLATDLFEKVNTPIQLIWGEKDPWESLSEAKEWKRKFKNIKRLDVIKGAGHCPHDEEPEKTNKLVCEFLQEIK